MGQANFLLAASISNGNVLEFRRRDGLIEGHCYSVLEVQEVYGVRMVRLRNPWGQSEWNGRWSRNSKTWMHHGEIAADIRREGRREDGSFWMEFDDFASTFNNLIVCPATMPVPKS